jgi:formylglycine-generating enzyme required for sulfatase activity
MKLHVLAGVGVVAFLIPPLLAAPEPGRKFALVVGINKYDGAGLEDLSFAENDAADLADALGKACAFDRVVLLTSKDRPTAAAIRRELAALLKGRRKADTVLVALAGHGVQVEVRDPKGDGGPRTYPFFCASDADLTTVKYATGHSDTMINLDHLFEDLGRSSAGVKLLLMDACRNELKAVGRARSLAEMKVTVPDGVQALLGCGRKQVAFEVEELKHGLFFHHVILGLNGKARNAEGEVTWASLTDYTTRAVARAAKRWGKVQTPAAAGYYEGETPLLARAEEQAVTNGIGLKLVRIPAGTFTMGSPAGEKGREDDEKQHEVRITRAFYLSVHEVTQKQFKAVMGYNPSHFSKDGTRRDAGAVYPPDSMPAGGKDKVGGLDTSEFPVDNVSWQEAKEFCSRLSAMTEEKKAGRMYRLPSEAEWEYACRGGAETYTKYHVGDELTKDQANFGGQRLSTCKVGSYRPNGFGLYDTHGNVWEWTADWYGEDYHATGPANDPTGPEKGTRRVYRGGGWDDVASSCRSAYRVCWKPDYRRNNQGFRIALVPVGR